MQYVHAGARAEQLPLHLQLILATPRGRAWNQYSPSLGSTMNVAFLATVYANYIGPAGGSAASRAKRYECWAETQVSVLYAAAKYIPDS